MKTGVYGVKTFGSDDISSNKSIMGMSTKGMEIAQYFLRDKIYTNKILAVVREYVSNALDEHKKYSIPDPVKVSLMSKDGETWFSVRDFAKGLSEDGIRNVFGMYFESTKSGDNDNIGGFGIGGKAAFSYTDTFYVDSYFEGTHSKYACTLGAGDKGIPVGEIYKISESPTTESGILISLTIKDDNKTYNSDKDRFFRECHTLVNRYGGPCKIEFHSDYGIGGSSKNPIVPDVPTDTIEMGGYKISFYKGINSISQYHIRIGGIPYKVPFLKFSKRVSSEGSIVIDVPIGKLTLPISRESVEDTASNRKVFEEIADQLNLLYKEELESFDPLCLGMYMYGKANTSWISNKWFYHSFNSVYGDAYNTRYDFSYWKGSPHYSVSPDLKPSDKGIYTIYVFPKLKNNNTTWHRRLEAVLSNASDYAGFIYILQPKYEYLLKTLKDPNYTGNITLDNCVFIDIKSLKLPQLPKKPKLSKADVSYIVYKKYDKSDGVYYSPKELEDYVVTTFFAGKTPKKDWYKTASESEINRRTVGLTSTYGRSHSKFYAVNSQVMLDGLVKLGWLTVESPERIARLKELKDERIEKEKRESAVMNHKYAISNLYNFSERMEKVIYNTPIDRHQVNCDRLAKLYNKLRGEDSLRGAIIRSHSKYSDNRYTRDQIRQILKLK